MSEQNTNQTNNELQREELMALLETIPELTVGKLKKHLDVPSRVTPPRRAGKVSK